MHSVPRFFIFVLLYLWLWRRQGSARPAVDDSLWLLITLLLMALMATVGLVFYLFGA